MEKKELEVEFSEFLIQKIKHAGGGSLPFHHLSGLLQNARYEMRQEFGTTKSELMKFLKAHSEIFHIDPFGMVTITLSSLSADNDDYEEDDDDDEEENDDDGERKAIIKEIHKGLGTVIKLHPEFGIIKAVKPFNTKVYFKSDAFSGNKERLLTDSCLQVGCDVYFNAVCGHQDYDIEFRATDVWLESNSKLEKNENQKASSNILKGQGIIQKIFSNQGFILVSGKNEIVYFDKNSVVDCNGIELANFFNVGDPVSFSASYNNEGKLECQWHATVVRKKSKEKVQSIFHTKIKATVQNRIENEPGKIYPHSHGACIKFRNTEVADGDSSNYFLYGIEVSDIALEFSDGDDVWFDAIKTKFAPGWRAVLVWVGDKPAHVNNNIYFDDEIHKISEKSSACYEKNNSTVSIKSKSLEPETDTPITQQSKSTVIGHAVSKKKIQLDFECKIQNIESHTKKPSGKKSNRKGRNTPRREILSIKENKGSQEVTASEKLVKHKPNIRNSTVNRLKDTRLQSNTEIDDISSHSEENYDGDLSYKDDGSDVSERSFPGDKSQVKFYNDESFLRERNESFASAYQHNSVYCDENETTNTSNEIKNCKSSVKGRPSIKKFEDIDGEIINLYCKAAIVTNSQLQKDVDFVLNVFYINGKSVEEQQVIDLKEIIKIGDHVHFNCFEIIDDFGEIHQKVTVAWKGPKPSVYEITPKEFIDEYELSVNITDELVSEYLLDERRTFQNSSDMPNSEETVLNSYSQAVFSAGSSKEIFDIKLSPQLKIAETDKQNFEEKISIPSHKLLSEMITQRLKSKGIISADLRVDFSDMLTQVISLVQKHGNVNSFKSYTMNEENVQQAVCSTCSEKKGSILSGKNKCEKHAAVQTIITGGIVAQSIYTQN